MQSILSADFYLFGLILLGSFVCSYSFLFTEKPVPNSIKFWVASALFAIAQFITSGYATQSSEIGFNFGLQAFAFSNSFYIISVVFQTLFCYSLLSNTPTKAVGVALVMTVLFSCQFFVTHYLGYISLAAFEVAFLVVILQFLQITFLRNSQRKNKSIPLNLLLIFTSVELIFACGRLAVVSWKLFASNADQLVVSFDDIPLSLILISTANMLFNVLSYQAMVGYWSERAVRAKVETSTENNNIRELLSERNKLIGSLSRVNKTAITGALSASIAHELNQPLGAIKLAIQLLKTLVDKNAVPPIAEKVMNDIENENQKASDLIKTLRAIFTDGGTEKKLVSLDNLIQSVLMLYKNKLQENHIQVDCSLSAPILINGNSVELHQVLINLINNSVDALVGIDNSERKLVIETSQNNQSLLFSISDNGPGVPARQIGTMFELIKDTKKSEGMGLGLWLVKFIVERHRGSISYRQSKFGGAQFDVVLPMSANEG
ncbi:hypothetical protein A8O14_07525 [Polynucleobacter wuianus]|uniref:histidine kinase n=1 Tax=Polynucleobacter wuianus TaxID=1743168 RepID=A0A191UGA2_9BURK|nr:MULTISPECIES: HAMP domain-containing sensor histidine kinase [Polynucleobacter]ANI99931.1 hypothetical protein A8O14_07525 [Polynucleobacter wuianus]MBU3552758.1 GHKL domain-containing protein [Polynucleobacter sp. MWH-Post4-6-1]